MSFFVAEFDWLVPMQPNPRLNSTEKKMRLVFWQNCLSPHQLPYIVKLMDDERVDEVVVAAGEAVNDARAKMGWETGRYAGIERCKVYVDLSDEQIESLLRERVAESVHLFSGIRGFAFVFKSLKASLAHPVRRCLITERPNTFAFGRANGKPLWMHAIRFLLQDRAYARHIDTVFAMGGEAVEYFRSVYKKWRVVPFMYCTQSTEYRPTTMLRGAAKFIFIGGLSYWKAPTAIANAFAQIKKEGSRIDGTVTFVGDGDQRGKTEAVFRKNGMDDIAEFVGYRPMREIPTWLAKSDVLILPSVYDGWGAVVNEALQMGLYVICSDACGASDLIRGDEGLGTVFKKGDEGGLASAIDYCMSHIDEVRSGRGYRMQWADSHISGDVVARYMIDCLCGK